MLRALCRLTTDQGDECPPPPIGRINITNKSRDALTLLSFLLPAANSRRFILERALPSALLPLLFCCPLLSAGHAALSTAELQLPFLPLSVRFATPRPLEQQPILRRSFKRNIERFTV